MSKRVDRINYAELERQALKLERMRHKEHFQMPELFVKTDCGTAACIAGGVCLDNGYVPVFSDCNCGRCNTAAIVRRKGDRTGFTQGAYSTARDICGLDNDQAARLFNARCWPKQFGGSGLSAERFNSGDYYPAQCPVDKALINDPKNAAARIRYFNKTKGAE